MSLVRAAWYHLRALVRRSRVDEELDLELRDHIARETKANVARGMSEKEARRAALVAFGGVERFREETRDTRALRWIDTTLQDLRYALRGLRRAPTFAFVSIATLGLGIGATTAVFTVVDRVLLRPLPFRDPSRLYSLSYLPEVPFVIPPSLQDRFYLTYRDQQRSFERVVAYRRAEFSLSGNGDAVRVQGAFVAADFWSLLGILPARGRAFLAAEDRPGGEHVVVMSDRLWRDRFSADERVIGRAITLDGDPYVVVGIAPPDFVFPYAAELWVPLTIRLELNNSSFLPVVGRLRDGVTLEQARAELDALGKAMPRDRRDPGNRRKTAAVVPLKQLITDDAERSLYLFAGAVALVLLIAGVNVANLLLMRAAARQHEIALRASLGANRGRLVRQLLTESLVVAGLGGILGTALAFGGVRALLATAPAGSIPRVHEVHVDARVLVFGILASLACGVIFGLVPALDGARADQRAALSRSGRTLSSPHGGLRSRFVMGEIALAFVLLTSAGLMIRSFARMRGVDTGYDASGVVTMSVDLPSRSYPDATRIRHFHAGVLDRLATVPGVRAVGAVSYRPMGSVGIMGDFAVEDGTALRGYPVDKPTVSPGYFGAMGIRLVRGRDFTPRDDHLSPGVVIISESVARRVWPNQEAVGKRISMKDKPGPNDWLTVIGVARDVVQDRELKPHSTVYLPYLQTDPVFFINHMTYVVRTAPGGGASSVAPAMRAALGDVDATIPVQALQTMDASMLDVVAEPRFQTRLLTTFSLLALLLAVIGTYGVLAYDVAERTREIGIRIALGAGTRDVRRLVIGRTLVFATVGIVLGSIGALAATRLLSRFLFGVTPTDPATFAGTAIVLVGAALGAGVVPALRATRVDPILALRQD